MKPTLAQMRMALAKRNNPVEMRSVGVNEAPDMATKAYMPPALDRKSTRLNSSHIPLSRMPSSA